MAIAGRGVSFATLGFLGAASLAFGLWSGLSGPRAADVQLHDAVADTLAAPGFVVTLEPTAVSSASGSPAYSSTFGQGRIVVDYEAPDDEVLTTFDSAGHIEIRITEIGSSCWVTGASSGATVAPDCASDSVQSFLSQIGELKSTTGATIENGVYVLSPSDSRKFAEDNSGSSASSQGSNAVQLGTPARLEIRIRLNGNFVDWIYEIAPGSFGADAQFADIGTAPPIVRPSGPPTSVG
jgi:hypothetical protein